MDEKKYSQLYQALLQEVLQFHSGNQRRWCSWCCCSCRKAPG